MKAGRFLLPGWTESGVRLSRPDAPPRDPVLEQGPGFTPRSDPGHHGKIVLGPGSLWTRV